MMHTGSEQSAENEFHGPGAQLSAHFVVAGPGDADPDGTVVQLLDTDDDCYAQGNGNYPPTAYIAVETSGQPTTPLSPAQCESLAQLDAWASETHNFPLTGPVPHGAPGVTGHCNPDGSPDPAWGNHSCPGSIRLAQIPGIVLRARALAIPVPPAPLPPETHDMDDNTFIRWCYMSILLRTVDSAGFAANMQWLAAGGSRAQVYTNLCDSAEGQNVIAHRRKSLGL
jgi:hypothetical protein